MVKGPTFFSPPGGTQRPRPGPEVAARVLEAKVALMYRRLPAGLAMGLAVCAAMVFLLSGQDARGGFMVWALANVLLAMLRFADILAFARGPRDPAAVLRHRDRLVLAAAAMGALWGMLPWFRFPPAPLYQMVLTVAAAGMAGGGIIFLSPLHRAYAAYVVALMAPLCVRLLAGGTPLQVTIGCLGFIYILAMLFASARNARWMEDALTASFENEGLVGRLQAANASLERQVAERTQSLSEAIAQLTDGLRGKELERQRAAQSDAEHMNLLQAINEGFGHVDAREVFLFANPAAEKIFGVAPGALVGRSLLEFVDPDTAAMIQRETRDRLEGQSNRYLCPITLDDGRGRLLEVKASPLHDAQGAFIGATGVFEDITERRLAEARSRQLEAELHHAQKLESIGSLAGGVAHDMNNILGAVQAIVQTLRQKHPGQGGLLADLEIIDRASTRGRNLVRGLTRFVRKELEEPEILDLNDLVREEVALLGRTTLQKVVLAMDLQEPLPAVMGERGALGGVLMNICVNAMDAMPEGGNLTVRTRGLPGGEVELQVEDTGKGMPSDVLDRAMEPFFTTKGIGKGTGLGLSMVYAAVKAHGGTVSLHSEVSRGTSVRIRLPAVAREACLPEPAAPSAVRSPPLRILQVDDDELILASIPRLLELQGHTVTSACSGQEALDRLGEGLAVDLVILDLNMPAMNGLETLQHLRDLRPGLPVLLATGFLDPATEAQLKQFGNALSITKPFSIQEMDGMLRRIAVMAAQTPESA